MEIYKTATHFAPESDGCGLLERIASREGRFLGLQCMSGPENPTTIKRLVQEIMQLTRKIVDLTAERETLDHEHNQYQQERHHYQYRFVEERQKRLHVERKLFEKQNPHYLEGDMDGSSASHAQAKMDRASQTDPKIGGPRNVRTNNPRFYQARKERPGASH